MKKSFYLILIAAFALTACGGAARSAEYEMPASAGMPAQEQSYDAMPAPTMGYADSSKAASSGEGGGSGGAANATSAERLVIQNADLAIVVKDPKADMEKLTKMAEEMGGFVVSSNLYQSYTANGVPVPEVSMVIRIPAPKLNQALDDIKKDAVEVQSETRSGQDVTADYVDLKSRLGTYEDALEQLEVIMKEKTTPEEVLNVFNQMTYYREQIELIKGQMKYYEEAAALSAISIRLIAEATVQPIEIGGWEPKGVARDAIQNLIYFWQGFVDFLINFVLFVLPVLITIAIPFYVAFIIIRWIFRRARKSKPETKTEGK